MPRAGAETVHEPLKLLARLVFLGFLAVLALAPLPFGANRDWSLGLVEMTVGFMLMLWALAALRQPDIVRIGWRRHGPITALFGASALWMMVQASGITPAEWDHPLWAEAARALGAPLEGAISVHPHATWGAFLHLLSCGGVFWLALQFGRDAKRARQTLWVLAGAGFAYALYGLAVEIGDIGHVLWYRKWAYTESLTSTFINRSSYATYSGFSLLATLALLLGKPREALLANPFSAAGIRAILDGFSEKGWVYSIALLTLATALLLTHSRAGFGAALMAFIVLVAAMAAARRMRIGAAVGYGALFTLVAALMTALSGATTLQRINQTAALDQERFHVFALTARAIAETPVQGTGVGTFQWIFSFFRAGEALRFYDKAHNSYLEYALGAGLPALALMLALFACLTALFVRALFVRRRHQVYPALGLAVLVLIGLHAAVDFSLQIPAIAMTAAALLGLALAQSWPTGQTQPER